MIALYWERLGTGLWGSTPLKSSNRYYRAQK